MQIVSRTLIASAALLIATSALAGPVTLKANPVDTDGQVTFGDIFDGAGASSSVVVARRSGPSVVMEAGQLQSLARQSGLEWDNPRGLRRVVIRSADLSPSTAASTAAPAGVAPAPTTARFVAPPRSVRAERVISRNDIVQVVYIVGAVRLTISGRAMDNAAAGEPVAIRNLDSGRTIDALAVSPGQAIAGPAARAARAAL
ncbi:flagellar basal body P-ring formation chaperone FlgA [uncultured Brevundimonas sp.]|uniref:flagellar basal body P-ring formation chaperone FlgA n=1 Tax=uncultured Brevundimonas sp. TaxID=213418 RepID=UPI0030EE553A|tara:strand:+ start:102117 stop:102719 length:603 start_codon:yes stop_codon:yes gene_type:complete